MMLDATDRKIIEATQAGLPLVLAPYAEIGLALGLDEALVIDRMAAMMARGVIRRIGAAPNHYAFGLAANGMTVWDVENVMAADLGHEVGALDFVSHCYLRPRALPDWPYNLFAMVHGSDRTEVERKRARIADLLGPCYHRSDILYSIRILKKTGLRLERKKG
jgi:DNA-binding Lrp family transcriptional regulator